MHEVLWTLTLKKKPLFGFRDFIDTFQLSAGFDCIICNGVEKYLAIRTNSINLQKITIDNFMILNISDSRKSKPKKQLFEIPACFDSDEFDFNQFLFEMRLLLMQHSWVFTATRTLSWIV